MFFRIIVTAGRFLVNGLLPGCKNGRNYNNAVPGVSRHATITAFMDACEQQGGGEHTASG